MSNEDVTAHYIWGALQTHMRCKELEEKEIKNHHVVHGVYAEWLVANSGKKEADAAKAESTKTNAAIAELKADLKKANDQIDQVKKEAVKIKGLADRALGSIGSTKKN